MTDILGDLWSRYGPTENNTDGPLCNEDSNFLIDDDTFYLYLLAPAIASMIIFSFTRKRTALWPHILSGRPGLLYPMDTMTRSSRISYACAFGATAALIYKVVINQKRAIDPEVYGGNTQLDSLVVIISMFIYGIVYYPVLACLALDTAFAYAVGSLFAWLFLAKEIAEIAYCDIPATAILILVARSLPSMLCSAYLSVSLPLRFVRAIMHRKYFTSSVDDELDSMTLKDLKDSHQGKYVAELCSKPVLKPPDTEENKYITILVRMLQKVFYKKQKGFRYPARLLSVMVVSAIVVYRTLVLTLLQAMTFIDWVRFMPLPEDYEDYVADVATTVVVVTAILTSIMSFSAILHTMSSFRDNLRAMYRADYKWIPSPYEKDGKTLCIGSMKYAGFQVAYIGSTFFLTTVIIFLLTTIIAVLVSLIKFGVTDWIIDEIVKRWPWLLITIVLWLGQDLLAKYVFLRDSGQYMRLDNRNLFFICSYFLFFYNIFIGLISCLLRIIKAVAIGLVMLARLDNSTLPRRWEWLDPGFTAYQGFIHMEAAHTHPVVIVFINLLAALKNERTARGMENAKNDLEAYGNKTLSSVKESYELATKNPKFEVIEGKIVNRQARFHWHVAYTLLTNPTIRVYRKGYMQALRIAQRDGLKIPMSDSPVSDFDLVKLQKEKEEEEEQKREEMENLSKRKDNQGEQESGLKSKLNWFKNKVNNVKDNRDKKDDSNRKNGGSKSSSYQVYQIDQPNHNTKM